MKADEHAELAARIQLKRVYEASSGADGARFLVERLWPRASRNRRWRLRHGLKTLLPASACGSGSTTILSGGMNSVSANLVRTIVRHQTDQ